MNDTSFVSSLASLYLNTAASQVKTSLSTSPPAEPFQPNLNFGQTVSAVTGETRRTAVDTSKSPPADAPTGQEGESFQFKRFSSARDVENSLALNFQSSITIPSEGPNASLKQGFDFSSSSTKEASSLFYLAQWEKTGTSKALPERPVLYSDAQSLLDKNEFSKFREAYGDYYVHQILSLSRFTALWRCTSQKESALSQFQTDLNIGLSAPRDVKATGKFEAALHDSASKNEVQWEVHFDTLGTADDVEFKTSAVFETLEDFRDKVKPANDRVLLRHNSFVKEGFPTEIDMDPGLYMRLLSLFATVNFAVFMNGLTPGTSVTRLKRREELVKIYKFIYAKRIDLESTDSSKQEAAWKKIKPGLDAISAIRTKLLQLLDRQEVVLKVTDLPVDDIKSLFQIDHQNKRGYWVNAVFDKEAFQFGETVLDNLRYGVALTEDRRKRKGSCFHVPVDALSFPPSKSPVKGTAVGIIVIPNKQDGTDGYWCIPMSNPLGKSAFKIEIKAEGCVGMDWTLRVAYIPDSEYTDMKFDILTKFMNET